jgi:CBS-domain-containing membrane protein
MAMTKTVHPPAGATALLAAVDPQVRELGWCLVPVVMLSVGLMFGVALVVGNLQRCYPLYWWSEGGGEGGERDVEDERVWYGRGGGVGKVDAGCFV